MRRQIGAIKHAIENNQPIPWMSMCERMAHALSLDCGKDFVPRADLDRAEKERDKARAETENLRKQLLDATSKREYLDQSVHKLSMERDAARAEATKLREAGKALVEALEYVRRWWDETGRDEGWHKSIGQHVDQALAYAKEAGKPDSGA